MFMNTLKVQQYFSKYLRRATSMKVHEMIKSNG